MRISGTIVAGLRHARELGYPTANLAYTLTQGESLVHGVYAGFVLWDDVDGAQTRRAAIVVGGDFVDAVPPKCEAHILDWSGDLYGREVVFEIGVQIRPLARFDSLDALKAQIGADVEDIRAL